MKKNILMTLILILGLSVSAISVLHYKPVALTSQGSLPKFDVDDLIEMSELIVIGEVETTLPSRWRGIEGVDLKNASPDDVVKARGLFTDSVISVDQILKGEIVEPAIRVRRFTGEVRNVIWANDSEPTYDTGKTYMLFLVHDFGPTANIDPGDYIAVGAFQGVYEIVDGKAISRKDEWILKELVAYIENSLSGAK